MFKQTVTLIIILFIVTSCGLNKTGQPIPPPHEDTIVLKVGQSTALVWDYYSIGFDTVYFYNTHESSPELGTVNAEIKIWIHKTDEDTLYFDLAALSFSNSIYDNFSTIRAFDLLITLKKFDAFIIPLYPNSYEATFELVKTSQNKVILSSSPPAELLQDNYGIDSAIITHDTLDIRVVHGGGCRTHYYVMYMTPLVFAESEPVQANLYIGHYNNMDFCRALLYPWLKFDLSTIKQLYQEQYSESGEILLNIYEYDPEIIKTRTVLYSF